MEKLDLIKIDVPYYEANTQPHLLEIPSLKFLTIEGKSAPKAPFFQESMEVITSVSHAMEFLYKGKNMPYVTPKTEVFWWVKGNKELAELPCEERQWKILMRVPDFVTSDFFENGIELAQEKKPNRFFRNLKLERIKQGKCAQVLHVGAYQKEESTINTIMEYINKNGYAVKGKHHKIYLSDPRTTPKKRLKTILRYAVKPV